MWNGIAPISEQLSLKVNWHVPQFYISSPGICYWFTTLWHASLWKIRVPNQAFLQNNTVCNFLHNLIENTLADTNIFGINIYIQIYFFKANYGENPGFFNIIRTLYYKDIQNRNSRKMSSDLKLLFFFRDHLCLNVY